MIKAIVVIAIFAAIGAAISYSYGSTIIAYVTSTIPQLSSLISSGPTQIEGLITTVKENWQVIAASMGTVSVIGGYAFNWLYKRNLQKKEIESNLKLGDIQSTLIQETGEKLQFQQANQELTAKVISLEGMQQAFTEMTQTLENKEKEVQKLIIERNQLRNLLSDKSAEEKVKKILEEAQKIH